MSKDKRTTRTASTACLSTIFLFLFLRFGVEVAYQLKSHRDMAAVKRQLDWPKSARWTGPDIAQCNKELWLRVKDGCDENSN